MTGIWTSELKEWMAERAGSLGFNHSGIVPVVGLDDPDEARDASRFEGWIDAGRAGEMEYLKRRDAAGRLLRSSVQVSHPWARSMIVCAMTYEMDGPLSIDDAAPSAGWVARYAWSGRPAALASSSSSASASDRVELEPSDYHQFLLLRLEHIARELAERVGGSSKCYVDTGPLVERSAAARAGIGWIGKNTCLLQPRQRFMAPSGRDSELLGCAFGDGGHRSRGPLRLLHAVY